MGFSRNPPDKIELQVSFGDNVLVKALWKA